jgi:hypothetical protein
MSNDPGQHLAPVDKKWSFVIPDTAEFAKKMEKKKRAICEELIGRKIVEQDDGVTVTAVYP